MTEYLNVAIPFQTRGNRRFLSDMALAEQPWLKDFIARFPQSFEHDEVNCVWWFIEPDDLDSPGRIAIHIDKLSRIGKIDTQIASLRDVIFDA